MTSLSERPTHRREFLGQIAGSAVVLAGTACVGTSGPPMQGAPAPAAASAAPPKPSSQFDDTWATRLTAHHKSVYDSPTIDDGGALDHASRVMSGYHSVLGTTDADLGVVLVIRHTAIPMALNDAMWAKYSLGKDLSLKDPTTNDPTERNPFFHVTTADKHALIDAESSLETLHQRGVVLLGCNLALTARAHQIAQKAKLKASDVLQELRDNLVPGVILQPSGIYAVARAQEMGCALISGG